MARPRCIRSGTTSMITRRCHQRTHRLRPSAETNEIVLYCLGLAAEKTGLKLHAVCVMSNHHHIVATDADGRMPDFTREFHRSVAKALNASQGQFESLWSNERTHLTELVDELDVLENIAYVGANPIDAGLVERPEDWPGVLLLPRDEPYRVRVPRPKAYFGDDSAAPKEVVLRIVPPEALANVAERVAAAIEQRLERARAKMRELGRSFLGKAAILATSFVKRARSFERRWELVPAITARRADVKARWLAARRWFLEAYHLALCAWRVGDRSVRFPEGTWWMRVFHGASTGVAEPPSE